jgi:hypothetical protein
MEVLNMPNVWQRKLRFAMVSGNVAGPADYRPAPGNLRPTIQLPCKEIDTSLRDVQIWADGGLLVLPVSAQGNVLTYMAYTESRAAQAGAVQDHAAHTHDLLVVNNPGAADQVEVGVGTLSADTGATVAGGAATGGVQLNAAAQAHAAAAAALQDIPFAEELLIGSNLAAFNIVARVYARVR